MSLICTTCGGENPDGSEFCEECGVELMLEDLSPAPASAVPEPSAPFEEEAPEYDPWDSEQGSSPSSPPTDVQSSVPQELDAALSPTAANVPGAKLELIQQGQGTGTVFELFTTPIVVGKFDPDQGPIDIDLSGLPGQEHISRQHAELHYDSGWMVRDLGSTNGVFIRKAGQPKFQPRLLSTTRLEDGDEVAFGNVRFRFRTATM